MRNKSKKYKYNKNITRKSKSKKLNKRKRKYSKRYSKRYSKHMKGGFFSQNTLNYKNEFINQADQIKDRTISSTKSSLGNVFSMGTIAFMAGLSAAKDAANTIFSPLKKQTDKLQKEVNQQVVPAVSSVTSTK